MPFPFFSDISYTLILDVSSVSDPVCDGIEEQDEAVEFAMRKDASNNGIWIPLRLSYLVDGASTGLETFQTIRGYDVPVFGHSSSTVTEQVSICGDLLCTDEVQFHWLANTETENGLVRSDMWALSNVAATLVMDSQTVTLFEDTFGSAVLK